MIVDPVTGRWADALFGLATRGGALAEVQRDTEAIGARFAGSAARAYLLARGGDRRVKRTKIEEMAAGYHPLTRNFVHLLLDRRREEVLLGICEAFRQRSLAARGAVEGVVESPRGLDSGSVAELARKIGRDLGKEVILSQRENPELLGGVRVFVGGRLIDYSVQGRLGELRRKLLTAELPVARN